MGDPSLAGRKVFKVFNQDFIVDERYTVTKELGQGAYGIVCAATNNQTGEGVAIKKVTNVFSKKILAKRALREIKLLQHFRGHRNITCLYDMDIPRPDNFNETYLYEGKKFGYSVGAVKVKLTGLVQSSWNAILLPSFVLDNLCPMPTSNPLYTRSCAA